MTTYTIKRDLLAATAITMATKDVRYYLIGLYFEPNANGMMIAKISSRPQNRTMAPCWPRCVMATLNFLSPKAADCSPSSDDLRAAPRGPAWVARLTGGTICPH